MHYLLTSISGMSLDTINDDTAAMVFQNSKQNEVLKKNKLFLKRFEINR